MEFDDRTISSGWNFSTAERSQRKRAHCGFVGSAPAFDAGGVVRV
jgi:hypothetical protein